MKNVIFLVVGLALGFVAGVFTGRCGAGANTASAPASAASVKAEAVDDVFSGEAEDGELVEVGEYGKFRLNPKQKEIVEKMNAVNAWIEERRQQIGTDNYDEAVAGIDRKYIEKYPFMVSASGKRKVGEDYEKLLVALLESRKKAHASK